MLPRFYADKRMAPQVGLEPTTLRLTAECSAIELLRSGGGALVVRSWIVQIILASWLSSRKVSLRQCLTLNFAYEW
jgi:hypothetical protein